MNTTWRTAWQGQDIVVYRADAEVDRFDVRQLLRVVLVHRGRGDSPGDLQHTLVELADEWLLFPADTGFAGRVNFERQDFWAERACVYWVSEGRASLPLRMRRGGRWLSLSGPQYGRWKKADFAGLTERWPLQGPQTWQERKWRRIEDNRPFAGGEDGRRRA